jgi:predicted alpha/beta-fold hydrolase
LTSAPVPAPTGPLLLVHTEDDPVAPVEALAGVVEGADVAKHVLRCGGHLGFGAVAGVGVYLEPFGG